MYEQGVRLTAASAGPGSDDGGYYEEHDFQLWAGPGGAWQLLTRSSLPILIDIALEKLTCSAADPFLFLELHSLIPAAGDTVQEQYPPSPCRAVRAIDQYIGIAFE